jgi:hypothetical protein
MKTTIIPAQITTVEDKIAGNLSFAQILLFLAALFLGTYLRPRFYIFNKNDILYRDIVFEEETAKQVAIVKKKIKAKKKNTVTFGELQLIEQFVKHQKKNIRLRFRGKGGIDVSIS